jgi:phosphate/sulfate permease
MKPLWNSGPGNMSVNTPPLPLLLLLLTLGVLLVLGAHPLLGERVADAVGDKMTVLRLKSRNCFARSSNTRTHTHTAVSSRRPVLVGATRM